ncbi:MAG TPA: hypothetical protein PKK23_05295 [Nitrospirales bacterium]|nr:hypothetical protein [Nitrospirales bacterium]
MAPNSHLKLHACDCGHFHLTYRSVTLHFKKEEFLAYAAHVGQMAIRVAKTPVLQQTMAQTASDHGPH